jgi:hypothetical protein
MKNQQHFHISETSLQPPVCEPCQHGLLFSVNEYGRLVQSRPAPEKTLYDAESQTYYFYFPASSLQHQGL